MNKVKQKNFTGWYTQLSMLMIVSLLCSAPLYGAKGKASKKPAPGVQQPKPISVDGQIPVADVIGQVVRDRQELQALRNKSMQEYTQQGGIKANCMQIAGKNTTETMAYVIKRIDETVRRLGPAPVPFAIFTMGSMARDESGFFTDLEIGILAKETNPRAIDYFKHFNQQLADRFFKLGEHPDVGGMGLRIDEGDHAPEHLRWWARYASPEQVGLLAATEEDSSKSPFEGSRIYISTPKEFARFLDPNFPENMIDLSNKEIYSRFNTELAKAQKNVAYKGLSQEEIRAKVWQYINNAVRPLTGNEKSLAESVTLLRNIRYMYGDKGIFDQYMKMRDAYFNGPPKNQSPHYNNRREELAYISLMNDVVRHAKPGSPLLIGKLGDTIDLKRTFYRFAEQCLTSLGSWYNVGTQNTAQIADKLVAMKRMSPEWGNALKELMNFAICVRLRKQMKLGRQGFDVPVTQKGYTQLKQTFAQELATATKSLAVATAAKNTKAITQAEDAILKAKVNIQSLDKMALGKPDSIMSPEIIALMNTKYLPLEKKLFETLKQFLAGDKNAFLGTDVWSVPVVQPVKTPVKKK